MTNSNNRTNKDFGTIINAFYQSNVSELLPAGFWKNDKLKGFHTDRNMLLDMYGKTERDSFTVADMFDAMFSENRSLINDTRHGLPAAFLSKSMDTMYWLAFLGVITEHGQTKASEFCALNTKDYFDYLYLESQNPAYRDCYGDLLYFNDECYSYSEHNIYPDSEYLCYETVATIGDALRLICKVLNLQLKESEEPSIQRSELTMRAHNMMRKIFVIAYTDLIKPNIITE